MAGVTLSDALGYFERILGGEIVACDKMKRVSDRIIGWRDNPGRWHYSPDIANRHIGFIETFCKQPAGKLIPLELQDFQKGIIAATFGFVDDEGLRKIQESLEIMGRKNGKSTKASATELDLLFNDGEWSPQIYNVATAYDQANHSFENCLTMLTKSPVLKKNAHKRAWDIYCPENRGIIKPLAANTSTLDGLDVSAANLDELGAIKNRDLYDLIRDAMAARTQPILLETTTAGFVRNGIYDSQYQYAVKWLNGEIANDRFIAFIYELDAEDDWMNDESCWAKANPGLGTIKSYEFLRNKVQKAKELPEERPTVMTKDFNVISNTSSAWLTYDELHNPATIDYKEAHFKYGVVGFDAADSIDLTAATILCMRPDDDHIYARHMAWIPQKVYDELTTDGNRRERDGVPYTLWIERGLMRVWPGNIVDKRCVLEWLNDLRQTDDLYCYAIGYDPWHIDATVLNEFEQYFGRDNCHKVRQGPQTLSGPMKQYKSDLSINRIVDNANPIAEWCRSNVMVRTDINGNIQPDKKNNDPRNRIDVWASEIDAYIVLNEIMGDYQAII